jgi:hypothetical protein
MGEQRPLPALDSRLPSMIGRLAAMPEGCAASKSLADVLSLSSVVAFQDYFLLAEGLAQRLCNGP